MYSHREDEERRIRSLGGEVSHWGRWRVQGILAVSRAIGDVSLQPFITCDPEIIECEKEDDFAYMVLASDGLWDVISNDAVGKFVIACQSKYEFVHIAKKLCNEALMLGSADNITVLIVDLRYAILLS